MSDTLAESLPLVMQRLVPPFVTDTSRAAALSTACTLLSTVRGDLEVRLDSDDDRIDVLQCLNQLPQDFTRLQNLARSHTQRASETIRAAWYALEKFALDHDALNIPYETALNEFWLEADANEINRAPSLFLSFQPALKAVTQIEFCERLLPLLLDGTHARALSERVRSCIASCRGHARVSHIGFMLGRDHNLLRVNIKGLSSETLVPYLESVAWHGDRSAILSLWSRASARVDHLTLGLNVSDEILPDAGLECVLNNARCATPRWDAWLKWLVAEKLCTEEKRDALCAWTGITTPDESFWSAPLIVESLLAPADGLAVLETNISHIKLVYHPHKRLRAKVYLWFAHRFLLPQAFSTPPA